MATATRTINTTQVTHVSVMADERDLHLATVEQGLRVLTIAGVHIYLDADGVTTLLEKLLAEPEAIERCQLLPELSRVAGIQQTNQVEAFRTAI